MKIKIRSLLKINVASGKTIDAMREASDTYCEATSTVINVINAANVGPGRRPRKMPADVATPLPPVKFKSYLKLLLTTNCLNGDKDLTILNLKGFVTSTCHLLLVAAMATLAAHGTNFRSKLKTTMAAIN